MMQPPMTPPGGGGLPPEILQALMAQNPQMAMDPGMAPPSPDGDTGMDPMGEMGMDPMMDQQAGIDPMAALTGMDPSMGFPSTDPNQIAAILAEMRHADMAKLDQQQMMDKMAFMQRADEAAMLAIQAVRDLQANSGMTATSPHEGFDSGIGQPPGDMIA